LKLVDCDLNEVVQIIDFVTPEVAELGIELILPGRLAAVPFDRDQIKQVLLNPIINAEHAMPLKSVQIRPRPVRGRAGRDRQRDRHGCRDAGPYLPPVLPTRKDGTGLGLPTARRIIHSTKVQ
jgi:nitrogen-specific signal transduction histidine kinase